MKNLLPIFVVLSILLALPGCLSYNDLQTGRTVDAKTNEVSFAANLSYLEKIDFSEDEVKKKTIYPNIIPNKL